MKAAVPVLAVVLISALGGCLGGNGQVGPQEALLPQDSNGNFVLYVSNQSFARTPVDITVSIDGQKAVSADFDVGNQHRWVEHTFRLAPGKHKLIAVSKKGSAQIETEFEAKDKHWAVVSYWYNPKQGEKKQFTFDIEDTPIGFL